MRRPFNTDILEQCLQRERSENEKSREHTLQKLLQLLPQLSKQYGVREAFVFGSLATPGRFHQNSDIDIAVFGLQKKIFRIHGCVA